MADTSDNYLAWPSTEAVMYRHRSRTVRVTHAMRTAITRREAATLGIGITPHQASWSFPVALLQGVVPQKADTFTDASNVEWTVGDLVELLGNNSRYRVIATRST